MTPSDRVQWLFPDTSGDFKGTELDSLDPGNEDDRTILIESDHGVLVEALDQDLDEVVIDGQPVNPQLHIALHSLIANQICEDNPPKVWLTAQRLAATGYERHEVLHMLASAVAIQVRRVLAQHVPFNLNAYLTALDSLPDVPSHDHDHAGHDHAGHDHAGHDHAGHDHAEHVAGTPDSGDGDQQLVGLLDTLAENGPLSVQQLARHLGADADEVASLATDPLVVTLADDRLASALLLLENTVFTHRLSAHEADRGVLTLGTDTAPMLLALCTFSHLHLADGQSAYLSGETDRPRLGADTELAGPQGWLGPALEGDLVGWKMTLLDDHDRVRLGCMATLQVLTDPGQPTVAGALASQLAASLNRFGNGNGVPTRADYLVCQLAADAPGLVEGVMAPISELLQLANLQEREGYAGRPGTDWEAFEWLQAVARAAALHGLDPDLSQALIAICRLNRSYALGSFEDLDREMGSVLGQALENPELAEAFADATTGADSGAGAGAGSDPATGSDPAPDVGAGSDPVTGSDRATGVDPGAEAGAEPGTRATAGTSFGMAQDNPTDTLRFLARVSELAKPDSRASVAWTESLVCGTCGQLEQAEAFLRTALLADPTHPRALEDAARYASDRGDAEQALRHLQQLGGDADQALIEMLRHYVPRQSRRDGSGRNTPCPCGSGRKLKHCCGRAGKGTATPLPSRVWWLWAKLDWWLARSTRLTELNETAVTLAGDEVGDEAQGEMDLNVATSLLLFEGGAAREFLDRRGPLLPADEAGLVERWAIEPRSVYEVTKVGRSGEIDVRDLRTGQTVTARHRYGGANPSAGQVVLAHAVFDGSGHQLVGGLVQIPRDFAPAVLSVLEEGTGSWALAMLLGDIRRGANVRAHG